MNVNRGFSSVPVQKKPSVQAMLNEYVDQGGWRKRFDELLGKRAAQYISSVVTLVNSDDKLMSVFYEKPMQVIQCALKAATYDLPLEKAFGFAYILPFGRDAVFVLGYKGIIQLALRTGQYVRINAIEVREGEIKSRNLLTEDFVFEWCEDPVERAKRPVVGYIAYYRLKNGMEKYFYMSKEEMQQHEKENRKGKFMSPTWKDRFDDMGKKTVLRLLLSKWGILSIDYQHADQSVQHFQENLANGTLDDEDTFTIEADAKEPADAAESVNVQEAGGPAAREEHPAANEPEEEVPMDWGEPMVNPETGEVFPRG